MGMFTSVQSNAQPSSRIMTLEEFEAGQVEQPRQTFEGIMTLEEFQALQGELESMQQEPELVPQEEGGGVGGAIFDTLVGVAPLTREIKSLTTEDAKTFGEASINALATGEAVGSQFVLGLMGNQPRERQLAINRILEQRPNEGDLIFIEDVMRDGFGITDEKLDDIISPVFGKRLGLFQRMNAVELMGLAASVATGSAIVKLWKKMAKSADPAKVMKEGFRQIVDEKKAERLIKQEERARDHRISGEIDEAIEKHDALVEVGRKRRERDAAESFEKAAKELNESIPTGKAIPVEKQIADAAAERASKRLQPAIDDAARDAQINKLAREQELDELSTFRGAKQGDSIPAVRGRDISEPTPAVLPAKKPTQVVQSGAKTSPKVVGRTKPPKAKKSTALKAEKVAETTPVTTKTAVKTQKSKPPIPTESVSQKNARLKKEADAKANAEFEARSSKSKLQEKLSKPKEPAKKAVSKTDELHNKLDDINKKIEENKKAFKAADVSTGARVKVFDEGKLLADKRSDILSEFRAANIPVRKKEKAVVVKPPSRIKAKATTKKTEKAKPKTKLQKKIAQSKGTTAKVADKVKSPAKRAVKKKEVKKDSFRESARKHDKGKSKLSQRLESKKLEPERTEALGIEEKIQANLDKIQKNKEELANISKGVEPKVKKKPKTKLQKKFVAKKQGDKGKVDVPSEEVNLFQEGVSTGAKVTTRKSLLEKTVKDIQNTETKKFTVKQLADLWEQSPELGRAMAESISDAGKAIYTSKVVNFANKRLSEGGFIRIRKGRSNLSSDDFNERQLIHDTFGDDLTEGINAKTIRDYWRLVGAPEAKEISEFVISAGTSMFSKQTIITARNLLIDNGFFKHSGAWHVKNLRDTWKVNPALGKEMAKAIVAEGTPKFHKELVKFAKKRLSESGSLDLGVFGFKGASKTKVPKMNDPLAENFVKKNKVNAETSRLAEKKNSKSVLKSLNNVVVDVSGNFKDKLDKLGRWGREAKINHDLTLGSNNKSALDANEAFDRIYGVPFLKRGAKAVFREKSEFHRFTREVQERFDFYIIAKRNVEILDNKLVAIKESSKRIKELRVELGKATKDKKSAIRDKIATQKQKLEDAKKEFKLSGGVSRKESEAYVNEIEKGLNDVDARIVKSAEEYWKTFDNLLEELKVEGLLTDDALLALRKSGRFYSPRQVIDWIDPIVKGKTTGGSLSGTLSVRDSGISRLSVEGTYRAIETDTQTLLNYAIQSTNKRIARNRANKALLKLAEEVPDNGVVTVVPFNAKAPQAHTVSVMVKGKPKGLRLSSEDYVEWIERDSKISADWANRTQKWSGSRILKFMATGGNPEFAVSNLARDMAHIWLVTDEFSKALPVAGYQMFRNMGSVVGDAVRRKGSYIDFIKQGGGMSFMTHQGRLTEKTVGFWGSLQEAASYVGETSEILTRLALRKRALDNLKKAYKGKITDDVLKEMEQQATWTARNFIDFSQGGSFIKAADNAVPYLNASIQGTRGVFRSAKNNPKVFTAKAMQIMGLSTGLYYAQRFTNPNTLAQVSDQDRKNNWIIPLGDFFKFEDKDGNPRYWHAKIPKDQGQRFFATLAEWMAIRAMGDDIDPVSIVESLQEALPNVSGILPPAFKAMVGYALNIDFWTKENVWRGQHLDNPSAEITDYTHPALIKATSGIRDASGNLINLSPSRLQDALSQVFAKGNVYTDVMGLGWKAIGGEISESDRKLVVGETMKRYPLIRKAFSLTDPFNADRKKQEKDQAKFNSQRVAVNREFDIGVTRAVDENDKEGLERMGKVARQAKTPKEVKRLLNRLKTHIQLKGIQEKRFWLGLSDMSPQPRAYNFVNKIRNASKEDKKRLLEDLQKIPAVASIDFMREVAIMLREEKKLGVGN